MKTLMTTANVSVQISVKTEGNHTDSKQNSNFSLSCGDGILLPLVDQFS